MQDTVLLLPLPSALCFGMAWWTIRSGKAYGRRWAIAASVLVLLPAIPLLILSLSFPRGPLLISVLLFAIGVAGIVAFARKNSTASPTAPAKPPRIKGDGTSRLSELLAWGVGIAGAVLGINVYSRWAYAHGLRSQFGVFWWIEFAFAILISTGLHECGHAFVGRALGMRIRMFVVGPLQWRIQDGRWKFKFVPGKIVSGGGSTGVVPTNPQQSRLYEIWMIAGGPAASLLTGALFLWLMFSSKGRPYEQFWEVFALTATLSMVGVLVNLIPLRSEMFYSDGAQIYQLLTGGPWADLHRAMTMVRATLVTPLRPRDFDFQALQSAANHFPSGRQAALLHLNLSSYFLDVGRIPECLAETATAATIYNESARDLPPEVLTEFVFNFALFGHDAAAARAWWDHLEARKPTHLGVDYWLARGALLRVEGNPSEAREAWEKANVCAQALPAAGAYEFDRYRTELLRGALDTVPTTSEPAPGVPAPSAVPAPA